MSIRNVLNYMVNKGNVRLTSDNIVSRAVKAYVNSTDGERDEFIIRHLSYEQELLDGLSTRNTPLESVRFALFLYVIVKHEVYLEYFAVDVIERLSDVQRGNLVDEEVIPLHLRESDWATERSIYNKNTNLNPHNHISVAKMLIFKFFEHVIDSINHTYGRHTMYVFEQEGDEGLKKEIEGFKQLYFLMMGLHCSMHTQGKFKNRYFEGAYRSYYTTPRNVDIFSNKATLPRLKNHKGLSASFNDVYQVSDIHYTSTGSSSLDTAINLAELGSSNSYYTVAGYSNTPRPRVPRMPTFSFEEEQPEPSMDFDLSDDDDDSPYYEEDYRNPHAEAVQFARELDLFKEVSTMQQELAYKLERSFERIGHKIGWIFYRREREGFNRRNVRCFNIDEFDKKRMGKENTKDTDLFKYLEYRLGGTPWLIKMYLINKDDLPNTLICSYHNEEEGIDYMKEIRVWNGECFNEHNRKYADLVG
jgi:hypothetical protein